MSSNVPLSGATSRPENALGLGRIITLAGEALDYDGATIANAFEAVALVGHSCMIAVDFRLIGLGEDHIIEPQATTRNLPKEWNANSVYAFKYAHSQSAMQYILKISRLGNNVVIFALADGTDKATTFDISVKDYISESALPLSKSDNFSDVMVNAFISPPRLNDLIGLFKVNVIQKLAPGLQKEGYEDTRFRESRAERADEEIRRQQQRQDVQPIRDPLRDRFPAGEPPRPYPIHDPLAATPTRFAPPGDFPPPGFEDEYEINRPPRGYVPGYGERRPLNIGEQDLYPPGLGPHDPLRPYLGPSRDGGGGGGGMHPTFDDPIFGGGTGEGEGNYNPQIPPGARYDPLNPGDPQGLGRGRGQGGQNFPDGGFGGGGFSQFFGSGPGGFSGGII